MTVITKWIMVLFIVQVANFVTSQAQNFPPAFQFKFPDFLLARKQTLEDLNNQQKIQKTKTDTEQTLQLQEKELEKHNLHKHLIHSTDSVESHKRFGGGFRASGRGFGRAGVDAYNEDGERERTQTSSKKMIEFVVIVLFVVIF